jgi:hypothetical protein
MQRFFTTIMTTAMLAHAVFGCCLHHAHSYEVTSTEAWTGGEVSTACCGHHVLHDESSALHGEPSALGQHGDLEHSRQQRCPCDGDKCNFARTESQSGDGTMDSGDYLTLLDIAAISNQKIVGAPFLTFSNTSRVVSSTLRRHLMLAILLI